MIDKVLIDNTCQCCIWQCAFVQNQAIGGELASKKGSIGNLQHWPFLSNNVRILAIQVSCSAGGFVFLYLMLRVGQIP